MTRDTDDSEQSDTGTPSRRYDTGTPSRRRFITAAGALGTAATAGCLSSLGFEEQSARVPPLVENRPDAVYHPTHTEAMEMVGMESAGPYRVALSYSFPHRFWTVSGDDRNQVSIGRDDSMHLMASVWHDDAGVVLPSAAVSVTAGRNGETPVDRQPWAMFSQRMGFHFGDNVVLPESGTYDVKVAVTPPSARLTGSFQGALADPATASFELVFDPETVRSLEFTQFSEKAGSEAALGPMDMAAPRRSQLPAAGEFPGDAVGEVRSGDGVFVVRSLESPPAGIEGSETYLVVSPRTPYNRYPLALMSLSATVERGGETRFDDGLVPTLDPDLGYHYGAVVGELAGGDDLTLSVGAPPQIARHEGYETAFFDMGPVELTVP
jgi:hypothetical protein